MPNQVAANDGVLLRGSTRMELPLRIAIRYPSVRLPARLFRKQ